MVDKNVTLKLHPQSFVLKAVRMVVIEPSVFLFTIRQLFCLDGFEFMDASSTGVTYFVSTRIPVGFNSIGAFFKPLEAVFVLPTVWKWKVVADGYSCIGLVLNYTDLKGEPSWWKLSPLLFVTKTQITLNHRCFYPLNQHRCNEILVINRGEVLFHITEKPESNVAVVLLPAF